MLPLVTDHTLVVISLIMLLGGGVIGAIITAVRVAEHPNPRDERNLRVAVAIGLCVLALIMVDPNPAPALKPIERALVSVPPEPVVINLADCPPRMPGDTDQLLMTISTRSDTAPLITGCTRITERTYTPKGLQ